MNALPEPSEFGEDCVFLDFCEADHTFESRPTQHW